MEYRGIVRFLLWTRNKEYVGQGYGLVELFPGQASRQILVHSN